MNRFAALYPVTLFVLVPLDFLFLGIVAKGFFAPWSATCWARSSAIVTAVSSTAGLLVANWLVPRI